VEGRLGKLLDIEDPPFPIQQAQIWQLGCQAYATTALYPQENILVLISARG
jgi:hypothetical protein